MADYKLLPPVMVGAPPATCVLRTADNAFIPFDEGNKDYVAYQAWIAAGNTPDPAT